MKYFILMLLIMKQIFCFCQIAPSNYELSEMSRMTGQKYILEYTGFNNNYDTTKYYLRFFKIDDWGKSVACFVYCVNPTWDVDYHFFMLCDCKPLDSAYNVAKKKYFKTHKKQNHSK